METPACCLGLREQLPFVTIWTQQCPWISMAALRCRCPYSQRNRPAKPREPTQAHKNARIWTQKHGPPDIPFPPRCVPLLLFWPPSSKPAQSKTTSVFDLEHSRNGNSHFSTGPQCLVFVFVFFFLFLFFFVVAVVSAFTTEFSYYVVLTVLEFSM